GLHQRVEGVEPFARLDGVRVRRIDAPEGRSDDRGEVGHAAILAPRRNPGAILRAAGYSGSEFAPFIAASKAASVVAAQFPSLIVVPGFVAPGFVAAIRNRTQ